MPFVRPHQGSVHVTIACGVIWSMRPHRANKYLLNWIKPNSPFKNEPKITPLNPSVHFVVDCLLNWIPQHCHETETKVWRAHCLDPQTALTLKVPCQDRSQTGYLSKHGTLHGLYNHCDLSEADLERHLWDTPKPHRLRPVSILKKIDKQVRCEMTLIISP